MSGNKKNEPECPETSTVSQEWVDSFQYFSVLRSYFNDQLNYQFKSVGLKYPKKVGLLFLDNTDTDLVTDFLKKIETIRVDHVNGAKDFIRLIGSYSFSLFPQFQTTESINTATDALQSGQIILMFEDEPTLIIGPAVFLYFFRKPVTGSGLSAGILLRVFALAFAIFLPAMYIAITSFQYYSVPLKLFFMLAESRIKAPFSPVVEVIFIEFILEIFREGIVRLNTPVYTIGVLGALAAAAGIAVAGLVTPITVIFCGLAELATLVLPIRDLIATIRCVKWGSIIMTALFGILGTAITASLTVVLLVSAEFSGFPYLQIGKSIRRR